MNIFTMMSESLNSTQVSLEEVFGQVMYSSVLTRQERNFLRDTLMGRPLNEDEVAIIDRLFYNVRRGWVTMVD